MARPLGLPVGSVRALCLGGLTARAILDLQAERPVLPWLAAGLIVAACSYFASRASRRGTIDAATAVPGAPRPRDPLGLPAGTIRLLFLLAMGYGAWLLLKDRGLDGDRTPTVLVVGAFFVGVLVRWFLTQVRRPEDGSTLVFEHFLALASLIAAGGLVAMGVTGSGGGSDWTGPALAAAVTFYFGAR